MANSVFGVGGFSIVYTSKSKRQFIFRNVLLTLQLILSSQYRDLVTGSTTGVRFLVEQDFLLTTTSRTSVELTQSFIQ
jgi:hypothetical protein